MYTTEYRLRGSELWLRSENEQMELFHAALGLTGEAGEVADLIKKANFTKKRAPENFKEELLLELGDVLYYLDRIAQLHDFSLADIMEANIEKLEKRYDRTTGRPG